MRARIFAEENRKWWTLAAVAFGLFMIMLDNTVVNVALPTIGRDFETGLSELEWVVNGYALTFGVLMLTGGKLADLLGRRRIFMAGLAIFTLASLACGLATSAEFLIGARVVQGVGSALMNPATLSIIIATFPPRQRGMAIGIWAGISALALAIGPLLGGLITDHIHWSWVFFINVPIGILAIVVARARHRRDPRYLCRPAPRPPGTGRLGDRPLRAHVRPDRGQQARLDVTAHPLALRRCGCGSRRLRPARATPEGADARPLAVP